MDELTQKCWNCDAANSLFAKFCSSCGASLTIRCANCKFENPGSAKFCSECGSYIANQREATSARIRKPTETGERRQLTVMFCDLVGSTAIAESMDVEDLREILEAYHDASIRAIHQYDGRVAKRLGDGLVVLFGYPQAHEDDAQRAIYAALGVVSEIGRLSQRIEADRGIKMSVRIGIHTGVVVAGESDSLEHREIEIVGETPTIAARLQELAEPGSITISSATYKLVSEDFEFIPLGHQSIKGLRRQLNIFRVIGPRVHARSLDFKLRRPDIVGRDDELQVLKSKWGFTEGGDSQVVLISGEPGIGKSRLTDAFKAYVMTRPAVRIKEILCSPYHQGTPFYAVSSRFKHDLVGIRNEDDPEIILAKLKRFAAEHALDSTETVSLLATLLSVPLGDEYPTMKLSSEGQRLRTLDLLARIYAGDPSDGPVLVIVENAQWADPSTLELIGKIMEYGASGHLMTLVTSRPLFESPWTEGDRLQKIELHRLENREVEKIVLQITGGRKLPPEVLAQVITKTDGVPLFVEELTKMVLESGLLIEKGRVYGLNGPIPDLAIPTTLHDSLMARLDRLSTVKEIAQLASVIGRGFSFDLLLAVSGVPPSTLRRELDRLVEAELIHEYQNDLGESAYRFRHALIQDAAYESLLKGRKQKYHSAIAQAIVSQFPETADTQPEILAAHYVAAGMNEPAIAYWIQAGQRALVKSANHEAIANFQKALDLHLKSPESPDKLARELTIQASMGLALIATKGFGSSEVGLCFSRAENLCLAIGESAQLFPVLWGLWVFYLVRAELQIAKDRAEHLLYLGESTGDSGMLIEGHFTLGDTLFWRGEFTEARHHLEKVANIYSFEDHASHSIVFGQDPGVSGLSYLSFTLWTLGYPEQALERSRQARVLAERRGHAFSTAWALGCSALLNHFRGDPAETLRHAQDTIAHSQEQGQPFWISAGTFLQGWAKFHMEDRVEGLAEMRHGLAYYQAIGSQVVQPHFMGVLAETLGDVGEIDEAMELVLRALEKARTHTERASEIDLYRIHAKLLLARSGDAHDEAIEILRSGVRLASTLRAKPHLMRGLAELYRLTDDMVVASELQTVINSYSEGTSEPPYVRARASLSVPRRKIK